jgi:hypothetical protein
VFEVPLHEITAENINRLVSEHTTESRHLEFKRQLPDWNHEKAVEEMMGDISAFGNTAGGDLIYGIIEGSTGSENTKCASGLINAVEGDEDALVSRITQLVRTRIEPRGFEVQIKVIECSPGTRVLVLRTPESYRKPLRVQSNGKWFFRYNNTKQPMEYQQIQDLFANSDRRLERVYAFRNDRISAILSNDSIAPFVTDKLIVYHFIPMMAYEREFHADLSIYSQGRLAPPACNGINGLTRPTMDGIAFFGMAAGVSTELLSKTEIFRSGVVEMVDPMSFMFSNEEVHFQRLCEAIAQTIPKGIETLKQIKVRGRVAFFLSIFNVGGMRLVQPQHDLRKKERRVSRRNLHFPDVIFEVDAVKNTLVSDTIRLLANAFGEPG